MKTIKTILKLIAGLLIGALAGLILSSVLIVLLSDITFAEFFGKFSRLEIGEGVLAGAIGLLSLLVSVFLLVIIHEGGHLVCGVLSGYGFVSFRIFDIAVFRSGGRLRVKRFSVAGTGGQCLLSPPDMPLERIPVGWYNIGGVLANILVLLIAIPFFWIERHPFVSEFLFIFVLTDLFLIVMNGVPMCVNGFGNDAWNIRLLRHDMTAKKGLVSQLRGNALVQAGIRPKDMPAEWFESPAAIDYKNALQVSLPVMYASRLVDEERYADAYAEFSRLYAHRDEIMGIYVNEIACELAYCALVTGRIAEAQNILDEKMMKYVAASRKYMSSKERLMCAVELYIHNDRQAAQAIYTRLHHRRSRYLLQGEVISDLALMDNFLK